ncbi:MAG: alpha/beta fold hydrolase [Candidatus Rokubacteria bacterium]|nr:alpha/beta fold hydrolase [Candidatus Rokubacteria bacterium]
MPYAKTDDRVKIYYEEHGRGFPLVLAYGIGGNTTMWEPNIKDLSACYRLILWDPRGHGRSDSPEDPARYSFRRWALDLRDLLNHLGVRKAYVGGLSMGGGIATRFTLLYPKRVAALIVTNSSSASGLPMSAENLVMRARSIEITLTKGMDAMAEFAMAANPNVTARLQLDPNAKEEFYAMYRALTRIGYANALRALIAMDHITGELPKIRVATLLIGGDQDPSLGPMKVMQKKVKGSKLVVLSPASHFANRDQPEAWNRAVLEFLARVDRRGR